MLLNGSLRLRGARSGAAPGGGGDRRPGHPRGGGVSPARRALLPRTVLQLAAVDDRQLDLARAQHADPASTRAPDARGLVQAGGAPAAALSPDTRGPARALAQAGATQGSD